MLFKYKGIDSKGEKIKGKMDVSNLQEAKTKLKLKKILYTHIEEEDLLSLSKININRVSKINVVILSQISRDLSIYLKAGISLVQAIKLISHRYEKNNRLGIFLDRLHSSLVEGKSLYTAIEQQDILEIPTFYKQSIKVSENSSLLEVVLHELSIFLKEQDRIKKQMSSSMAYPVFIFFVSVLMVGFMLSVIVPKITSIFIRMDNELPAITSLVINIGDFFSSNYLQIILLFMISLVSFSLCMKYSRAFKYSIHTFLLKIPFLGSLIELNELSRFSYMNSILIRSGVPIVQSINMSADILKSAVIQALFKEASNKIVEGEKLSTVLKNSNIFKIDTSFIHAIAVGEETSELSNILNNLALLYSESSKEKISIFLTLLEPIMMLIVGSIIGFIVLAMLLPIFSMNLG